MGFTMVIPDSAFISNFSMIIRDIEYVAQVKEKEDAKKTFNEAINQGRGAGIISKDIRDANIFTVSTNIEPGAKVIFKLTYEELLERKSGKYEHSINIDPKQLVDDFKIEVFINESLPISSIFVPELIQSNELDFIGSGENTIAEVKRNVDGVANNARIVFAPDKSYQEEAGAQGLSGQFVVQYDVDRQGEDSEVQVIDGYFVHYPPRSLAQDFMQKLHAFINIKQLIRKADLGEENEKNENEEKALMLALNNNFVTDLTSLVVVRPDEELVVSSLKYPNRAQEGILPLSIPSFASFNPGVATRNSVAPGYSAPSRVVGGYSGYSVQSKVRGGASPTFKRKGGGGILSLAAHPTTSRRQTFTTTYRPVTTTTTTYRTTTTYPS